MKNLFEKKVKIEEKLFLSLCSLGDKQKITQQAPMAYIDYLRITYILYRMNLLHFIVKFNELFPEFYQMKEHMLKRHIDILKEYPNYYIDEDVDKKEQNWLIDFCNQISDTRQREKYARIFNLK